MANMKIMYRDFEIEDIPRKKFVEDYIQKRLGAVEKMLDGILKIDVDISQSRRGFYRVEIMVHTPRNTFRAEEVSESIEGSADIVVDELKSQISRKKDKLWAKVKRGARILKDKMSFDENARS